MLRNIADLRGYAVHATDGIIGEVDDFYVDDEDWAVRYLIVNTGGWLTGRKVLISPLAIGHPDWLGQMLPVSLSKAQIEHSPDIDTRKPVSRQQEVAYHGYYAYPYYWEGAGLWGMGGYPGSLTTEDRFEETLRSRATAVAATSNDCHLRSCLSVIGHRVHATDGDLGHVSDFLVDERTWAIRYVIVETGHWWSGHQVLIAPAWITAVDWSDASVTVDVTRDAIKGAPPYDPTAHLERQQEQSIYEHHGRPDYWTTKAARDEALTTK